MPWHASSAAFTGYCAIAFLGGWWLRLGDGPAGLEGRAAAGPGRCRGVDGDPGAWVAQLAVLVRLLGPVEFLSADGSFAAVSQSRQRVLLAMLAVVSGRMVAAEALVDALWAEEFSRDREKNLHSQVSALRRRLDGAVAGGGSRLLRVPGGYRLALSAQELDVGLFRALAGRGREAARAGDAAGARATFGEALDMWRGPALADVTGLCSRLAGEAVVLDEQRAAVLEERLECDLALGRHGEIAGELTGLVREFPLRERMAGQLMVALYRCGRRGEALAVFDQARRVLAAELGLDPGPELAQTQRRVLADDPALAAQAVTRTALSSTVTGAGPGQGAGTGQIEGEPKGLGAGPPLGGLPGAGRQAGSASSLVPRQLPADAGFFAGRRAELKALDELLDSADPGDGPGTVVVTAVGGLAGVGKTALAVHWARKVADRFPDGQLYVNLHGFDPRESPVLPEEAMSWFLSALGVPAGQIPADGQARAGLYRTVLAGRRVLTVIDNARDAAQARPLLAGGPGCLAVVTSRSAMAGLAAADGARLVQLGPLKTDDSARLLAARLGPDLIAAEADAVGGLVKLCDGLPLALAIVAARAAARPGVALAALTAELERAAAAEARVADPEAGATSAPGAGSRGSDVSGRLELLETGDEATSLRAVFSWSLRHLTASASEMFALLGVHCGPDITAAAAASLAGQPPARARALITELVNASLITEHHPGRYVMHDLVRGYAAGLAREIMTEGDIRAATGRSLDHYLHSAAASVAAAIGEHSLPPIAVNPPASGVSPEQLKGDRQLMGWLKAEHKVLLQAVAQAAAAGCDTHAWQIAYLLSTFLDRDGHWDDWAAVGQIALDAAQQGDPAGLGWTRMRLARRCTKLGEYGQAVSHGVQALEHFRLAGDLAGQAYAHFFLAISQDPPSPHPQTSGGPVLHHGEHALRLFRETGNEAWEASALTIIGGCHMEMGNYDLSLKFGQHALKAARESGTNLRECDALEKLGESHYRLGNYAQAITFLGEAARLATRFDHGNWKLACICISLGDACLAAGDRQAATGAWHEALNYCGDNHAHLATTVRERLEKAHAEAASTDLPAVRPDS